MAFLNLSTDDSGLNLYAIFHNHHRGWVWDNTNSLWRDTTAGTGSGNGGVNYGTSWSTLAVSMTEDVGTSSDPTGIYQLSVPASIEGAIDCVDVTIYERAGGSPVLGDAVYAQGSHSPSCKAALTVVSSSR